MNAHRKYVMEIDVFFLNKKKQFHRYHINVLRKLMSLTEPLSLSKLSLSQLRPIIISI